MRLRTLSTKMNLRGKRVLLRVDWNVPLRGGLAPEESLKIERSLQTIALLRKRGTIVILLTHLGRPEGRDPNLSTQHLLPLLKSKYHLDLDVHTGSVSRAEERAELVSAIASSSPGDVHLLENVRFEAGEETNSSKLAHAFAELGDLFVNDAFASCHRAHASVVGIAKLLPSYAGPALETEVRMLESLVTNPKHPFIAIIGGLKLSTKVPVLRSLLTVCDRMLIGGAMATTFLATDRFPTGRSFVETSALSEAKGLLTRYRKKIGLPVDVVVADKASSPTDLRRVTVERIGAHDSVRDVGPKTLAAWAAEIRQAKTILWNGPVGVTEVPATGAGSRFLARVIASRARGTAFGVAGGGDTLPVIQATRTTQWFDHVSTGGGALLEFIAKKGKLPGLIPLVK